MERLKTEIRQEQLISKAIEIIHTSGFENFSVRELSSSAGITDGAIYRHFKSKDEILQGIYIRINKLSQSLFNEISKLESPKDKLRRFIFFNIELFEKYPELTTFIISEDIHILDKLVMNEYLLVLKKRQSLLIEIIKEGISKNEFKEVDPDIISIMIQGYTRLTLSKWKKSNLGFSLSSNGMKFISTLEIILFN